MQFCVLLPLFLVVASSSEGVFRRLLRPPSWPLLSDRIQFSDHTHDLSSLDSLVPLLRSSPLEALFGPATKRVSQARKDNETIKKNVPPNADRESEDPEEERETKIHAKEVFVNPPARPDPENEKGEDDQDRPLFVNSFPFNPISFSFGLFTPWWKGPNVCIERSEVDETGADDTSSGGFMINFEATQCSPTETTYTCTKKIRNHGVRKTIVIKHQCCHGFAKRTDGKPGCSEVSMDNTMETLKSLEADKFAAMIASTDMADKVLSENFTMFVPINDAVVDFEDEAENNEIAHARPPKDFSYLVGGHLVDGYVNLGHIHDDEVLQSVNGKTTIRINKYRPTTQTITTANCIPVTSKDNMATNGIVHVVSNVLTLPRKTVADIITASPKISVFSKLLSGSKDLLSELGDTKKSFTVFVPTDKAFQNMDSEMLQRLLTGEGCVESILRNHLVKGTFCASGMMGRSRIRNGLGQPLTIAQDDIKTLTVQDVKVSSTDILGTNGVVHFIDEVIIPTEARSVLEALKNSNRQDLTELIKLAKLDATFENLRNITFFAPSKDAIKGISNETMEEWTNNPEKLEKILLYHLVAPQTKSSNFRHNQELASLAENNSVRLQLHEMFPGIALGATVQCSMLVKHDDEVCGAVLHSIDKVLMPPKSSIMEALKAMKGHSTITKLIESTDLESKLSNEGQGPYTLLAPNDEAFERFDNDSLQELLENKTKAEQILRMHILPEALCCSGVAPVFPFRHHYVRTLEGNLLSLHRNGRSDRVRFGTARAVQCDTIARNGIIHSVNKVILPHRRPITSIFDMDIFGGIFK